MIRLQMCDLKQVILTCGYRRTGKDTFFTKLSSDKQIKSASTIDLFRWRIYKQPTALNRSLDYTLKYQRTAFADSLKEEAAVVYGIPVNVPDDEKDVKQFIHYRTGDLVSSRDIHIEWGGIRRSEDPDYWCKEAFKRVEFDKGCCVVTDWRYHNEAEYTHHSYDVITVRLYRSDVPVPDPRIESEHNLDNYRTDFLLLRDDVDGEYEKAVEIFPQYIGYVPEVSNESVSPQMYSI